MNQRRDFFKKSSLAAVAAMTGPSILNAAVPKLETLDPVWYNKRHKLSIFSYTFNSLVSRGMQDIFGYFEIDQVGQFHSRF